MKSIFGLIAALFLFSCSEKKQPEKLSHDCELQIGIFGMPGEDACAAYFNLASETGDTLFVSKSSYSEQKRESEVEKVKLKSTEIDTLFSYFENIKENFKLGDQKSVVNDGTKVRVTIANNNNTVIFFYAGLDKAENADPEVKKLIHFINSRMSRDFQMR